MKKFLALTLSVLLIASPSCPNVSADCVDKTIKVVEKSDSKLSSIISTIILCAITCAVSSYVSYKLGQKSCFDKQEDKNINLIGPAEATLILGHEELRSDVAGHEYAVQLLKNQISQLKGLNSFEIKHLFNLEYFASVLRLILNQDNAGFSPEAKKLAAYLQGKCVMINNFAMIPQNERIVTLSYLTNLIEEMDSLFMQSIDVINEVCDRNHSNS